MGKLLRRKIKKMAEDKTRYNQIAYFCQWKTYTMGDDSGGDRHGCAGGSEIRVLDELSNDPDILLGKINLGHFAGVFVVSAPITDRKFFERVTKSLDIPALESEYHGRFIPSRVFREDIEEEQEER